MDQTQLVMDNIKLCGDFTGDIGLFWPTRALHNLLDTSAQKSQLLKLHNISVT